MDNYLKLDQILTLLDETKSRVRALQEDISEFKMPEPTGFVYKYPSKTLDGRFIPGTMRNALSS